MNKKWTKTAVVLSSMLVLNACSTTGKSEAGSVENTPSEQISDQETIYQHMYEDSSKLYDEEKYDEAAGHIALLLQNDLSGFSELKEKAKSLEDKIITAQADAEVKKDTYKVTEKSNYKPERHSVIASEEFASETGADIKKVPDTEIKQWMADKEKKAAQTKVENINSANKTTKDNKQEKKQSETKEQKQKANQSKEASESTAKEKSSSQSLENTSSADSSKEKKKTIAEEQNDVLDQVMAKTGISASDNQFFATKVNDHMYQVEIRYSHEVDGVELSNMVGMFRYDISSGSLKKMDPITGNYKAY
ncbi:MAG: hypothetical protein L0K82_06435 [Pisciglobus halotolerans]|nr:hypothetical protein [Pisciglobus halotolerans]